MTAPPSQRPSRNQGRPEILLSIAIFTFERASLLARTLQVFQTQIAGLGVNDIEVVVSDNASSDDTEVVARSFADRFPHFQYHRQPTNIGAIRNYFAVTRLARGRFVWPFSDDDLPVDGIVERVRQLVQEDSAEFILGNYSLFSMSSGAIHLDRALTLAVDRRFASSVDLVRFVGLFEAITLVSVAVFDRARFVAVDPQPYLADETWFAHVYVAMEAFAHRPCLLLAVAIALHNVDEHRWRTQWRETSGRGHLYLHTIGTLRAVRVLRQRGIVPASFLIDVQEPEVKSWDPRVEVVQPTAMLVLRRLALFALAEMQEQRYLSPDEWQLATEEFAALQRPDLFLLLRQINLATERLRVMEQIRQTDLAVLEQYRAL
jgi:hypothetical protein